MGRHSIAGQDTIILFQSTAIIFKLERIKRALQVKSFSAMLHLKAFALAPLLPFMVLHSPRRNAVCSALGVGR
jgi:hypothetical protein